MRQPSPHSREFPRRAPFLLPNALFVRNPSRLRSIELNRRAVRSALHVVSLLSDRLTGVAIVACLTWGFLRLKARIMEFIVEKDDDDPLERILLPVSG